MTKNKKIITSLLGLAMVSCLSGAIMLANADGTMGFSEVTLSEFYSKGSVLELPSAVYTKEGTEIGTTKMLEYPDGRITSAEKVTLDQPGVYEVTYTANVDGKRVTMEKSFTVKVPLSSQGNNLSTIEYGTWEGVNGLLCNIVSGDTMQFSSMIDLSAKSGMTDICELFVYPTTPGVADFEKFEFILTDVYDESNYVSVVNIPYNNGPESHGYTKAAAPSAGQLLTGYESQRDYIHVNNIYGTVTKFIYQPESDFPANSLQLSIDNAERRIYVNGSLVVDLDDPKFFSKLWDGFTTGQVKLSIKPSNGATARFVLTDICDMDLSNVEYADSKAPAINVAAQEIPPAVVSYPYKVFDASAFDDITGSVDVDVKVWRNYYSSSKLQYQVKNGAFTPDRTGDYIIEYKATDWFGNVATEIVKVTAVNLSDVEEITVTESGGARTGAMGLKVPFGEISASGGSGTLNVSVKVTDSSGNEAATEETGFIPYSAGVYTVTITARDYVGRTAETSYGVNVDYNNTPVFEDEVVVSKYMIVGGSYKFPELYAADYSMASVKKVKASVSVITASGEKTITNTYTPTAADAGKEITIRYTAQGEKGKNTRDYKATVIDVKNGNMLDMTKYFDGEGIVESVANEMSITYTIKNGGTLNFINPILYRQFTFNFTEGGANGKIDVYLTGYDNPSQQLKISLIKKGSSVVLSLNDGKQVDTSYIAGKADMDLTYDNVQRKLSSNGVKYDINNWLDGSEYNGFDGEKIWLSVKFSDYSENEEFTISKLNGQIFSYDTEEYSAPQIVFLGEYGGTASLGSRVKIVDVIASDVLNSYVELTVSVRGPDKKYVTSTNGVTIEDVAYAAYEFDCTLYGKYTVTFNAVDGVGNTSTIFYVVSIANRVPPTITLSGDVPTEVKSGEEFNIPTAEVTDDLTSADALKVSVFIRNPDGTIDKTQPGSLTLTKKGKYTVTYLALDGDGNVIFADYEIIVK